MKKNEINNNGKKVAALKFQVMEAFENMLSTKKSAITVPQMKNIMKNRFQSNFIRLVRTDRIGLLCKNLTASRSAINAKMNGRIR